MKNNKTRKSQIKKSNSAFNKLSDAKKRVAIAYDVIAQLDAKKFIADSGIYVLLRKNGADIESTEIKGSKKSLRDLFKTPDVTCSVCAKGALFMSYVGEVNKFQTGSLIEKDNESCYIQPKNKAHKKLSELFDKKQLALIENAFEYEDMSFNREFLTEKERMRSVDFGSKLNNRYWKLKSRRDVWSSLEYRLRSIMKNIIKNNGTFKP